MEDTFRARVDKVFGSLASSSTLTSLWSLTDQEIQKTEWNRDTDRDDASPHRQSEPYPSNLDGFFAHQPQAQLRTSTPADFGERLQSDLQDLDDDHEDPDYYNDSCSENKKRKKPNPHAVDDNDFDIRSSIGLDCTLDYEEEEDEYDKVAVGREKAGDRLYMRDIVDYEIGANSHNELPSSFKSITRDPRANHMAAKLRLKEDAETAGNFDSLKLSDAAVAPAMNAQGNELENGITPKPILKKREILLDGKSPKRVRFQEDILGTKDPGAQSNPVEGAISQQAEDNLSQLSMGEAKAAEEVLSLPRNSTSMEEAAVPEGFSQGNVFASSSIPDYLRNPSRYTRYTLDSSDDMDEESNRKAYMDFLNLLKKPNAVELCESSVSSPKSLIFTPKRKANDTSLVRKDNEFKQNQADISKDKAFPVGIAAGDAEDSGSEACPMEEDKPEIVVDKICSAQKPGRRYRTRTNVNYDDHVIT